MRAQGLGDRDGTRVRGGVLGALATGALLLALLGSGLARADFEGSVYLDVDGDGSRGAGEPGVPNVVVSNGRDVVRSDGAGRYRLPETGDFVFVTRPAGRDAAPWYRRGGGDFGLRSRPDSDRFFFVHLSDAHVYPRGADFTEFSSPLPGWIPDFVRNRLFVWQLGRVYGAERLRAGLEQALRPPSGSDPAFAERSDATLAERSDATLMGRWLDRMSARSDAELQATIQAAFAEVGRLGPGFVVHTGDLVLEGNRGSAEAMERWFRFYRKVRDSTGIPFYETIGNNELAGTENADFEPSDPRYGRALFHEHVGPSHYSFDRGDLHFLALDTHRRPTPGGSESWSFARMEPDVRHWLDADLAAHAGRRHVVLNHEPFHFDPAWPFEPDPEQTADDEGLFARHGVRYVLSGHTHYVSHKQIAGAFHTTAGALSGMRWVLPPGVHARGYRLVQVDGPALYSAWKETGEPLLTLADGPPGGNARVVAAADVDAPYATILPRSGGRDLPFERLGRYFVRVLEAPSRGTLEIEVTRSDGTGRRVSLDLAR